MFLKTAISPAIISRIPGRKDGSPITAPKAEIPTAEIIIRHPAIFVCILFTTMQEPMMPRTEKKTIAEGMGFRYVTSPVMLPITITKNPKETPNIPPSNPNANSSGLFNIKAPLVLRLLFRSIKIVFRYFRSNDVQNDNAQQCKKYHYGDWFNI